MSIETDKGIKFPSDLYVGFRLDQETLTGFMTPAGTDSSAKKRIKSVQDWVRSGRQSYNWQTKEYDDSGVKDPESYKNEPLQNFVIERRLNRGGSWHGSQDKWKIDDPRGFQLEISGSNLQKIIEYCEIKNGVIQQECIWARLGSNNILVPVNSEIYENTLKNTVRISKSVSLKDMMPGDYVVLQNGYEGIFQGCYYTLDNDYKYDRINSIPRTFYTLSWSLKKKYIFSNNETLSMVASPKISSIGSQRNMVYTEMELNSLANRMTDYYSHICISGHNTNARALSSIKQDVTTKLVTRDDSPEELQREGHYYTIAEFCNCYILNRYSEGSVYNYLLTDKNFIILTEQKGWSGYHLQKTVDRSAYVFTSPYTVMQIEVSTPEGNFFVNV